MHEGNECQICLKDTQYQIMKPLILLLQSYKWYLPTTYVKIWSTHCDLVKNMVTVAV